MVEIINAYAQASAEVTGRAAFGDRVLRAMTDIPRHEFVPPEIQPYAYADGPLPIGHEKTISQPFIVALMVDLLSVEPEDNVLEVGTGLGYCAAILGQLAEKVYSVEIIQELADGALTRLGHVPYDNITVRVGNGYYGWSEHAPFDKILVAAAPEQIPAPLVEQLRPGGRMVLPLGTPDNEQHLIVVDKAPNGELDTRQVLPVRFAPLVMAH